MIATSRYEDEPTDVYPRLRERDLSLLWPKVSLEVYRRLRRRGASHEIAEDIVQDVALKILSKGVVYTDAADLTRFAHHAARQRWIDLMRQRDLRQTTGVATIDAHSQDVAQTVVESLTARRALRLMRDRDRAALFGATAASDVLRHRARRRLDHLWQSLGAWMGCISWRRARRVAFALGSAAATAFVVVVVGPAAPHFGRHDASGDGVPARGAKTLRVVLDMSRGEQPRAAAPAAHAHVAGTYHERVSLPTTHVNIGPKDDAVLDVGSRPTGADDAIVCVFKLPVVGSQCIGHASKPIPDLPLP